MGQAMTLRPFHLAIPVDDLDAARRFYGEAIGCAEGRSDADWIDFDFFGHQLVVHRTAPRGDSGANPVDGHAVPIPHFGLVMEMADWRALAERLRLADTAFEIEPTVRFAGQPGEQATMFFRDPAGNAIEMKAFADDGQLFAR